MFVVGILFTITIFMIGTMIADVIITCKRNKEEKRLELARQEAEINAEKIAEKLKETYYKIKADENSYAPYLGDLYNRK